MAKVKPGCRPVRKKIGRKTITVRPAGTGRSAIGRKLAMAKYGHTGCPLLPGQAAHRKRFSAIARSCDRKVKAKGKAKFRGMGSCVRQAWAAVS